MIVSYGLLEVGRRRRWEVARHVLVVEVIVGGVSHRHIWLRVIRIKLQLCVESVQ